MLRRFSRPLGRLRRPTPGLLRIELLGGLVVGLALIPEAISFSVIAGVDPKVGLFASCTMAMTIAFVGGRPAMISAATGAMALVIVGLVRDHGVEYLFAATILAGLLQVLFGAVGIAKLMRFVPTAVMTGFVNALGILLFVAQIPHLREGGVVGIAVAVAGLALIVVVPRVTKAIPGPLVAVVVLTAVVLIVGIDIPNVGDEGELPDALPVLGLPSVPFDLHTLTVIAPYSLTLAVVGLLESLMTARLVDDITETPSNKDREARGQGIANVVTGLFGGLPGCGMIGQTMINVRLSGARTRLSTFSAGLFLLILCVGLGDIVARIPMEALAAVMVFVAWSTFDWHSIRPRTLRRMPVDETIVMAVTVAGTVATSNLAIGVVLGTIVAMIAFSRRAAGLVAVQRVVSPDGTSVLYAVSGELFFASDQDLVSAFRIGEDPAEVVIDLSGAHIWDASAVAALDAVQNRYERHGARVEITGFNGPSRELHRSLSGQLAGAH
jgi:SulP family sulfate permease